MASSSSAKKVARVAARSGGGASAKKQANWIFPVAIVSIVALGIGAVVYARSQNSGGSGNDTPPRAQLSQGQAADHWHNAFAISVCGKEQPPLNDVGTDVLGIHSHGDGLIHIHPFATRAAGKNATMKRFFDQVQLKVTDQGFETSAGQTYKEGETTCGGKPGEVVLAHWKDAATAPGKAPDKIYRKGFSGVRFTEDLGAFTLAFVAKGSTAISPPSASAQTETLGACDGANPPPECDPSTVGSTVPDGSGSSSATTDGTAPSGTTPTIPAAGG